MLRIVHNGVYLVVGYSKWIHISRTPLVVPFIWQQLQAVHLREIWETVKHSSTFFHVHNNITGQTYTSGLNDTYHSEGDISFVHDMLTYNIKRNGVIIPVAALRSLHKSNLSKTMTSLDCFYKIEKIFTS